MLIHSSIDGHCGSHLLATVNNAAINLGVQTVIQAPAFDPLRYIPRPELAGSQGPTATFEAKVYQYWGRVAWEPVKTLDRGRGTVKGA